MNTERPLTVSVIDPITPALDRVKLMLFRPFDFEKWLIIGFSAWLGRLGNGTGGPNFNFNSPGSSRNPQFQEHLIELKEFVLNNLTWIIPVGIFILLLFAGIGILIMWLSSRGKFMFLHCIAGNKAEVKIPWEKYRGQAFSLFLFRFILGLIGFIVIAIPVIIIIFLISVIASIGRPDGVSIISHVAGIIFLALCIFVISICLGVISKFTQDFVVPVMFLQKIKIREAWKAFLKILSINKVRFLLYLLFQIVIGMAVGAIIITSALVTCCCACCFFAIPYIGTVILLPVHIFNRTYSLYYLKQFGMQFDVFSLENPQFVLGENSQ
jgi:hypothetical protein